MIQIYFSILTIIVSALIIFVVGFVGGSSFILNHPDLDKFRKNNKEYVLLALLYKEFVLNSPIFVLLVLLIYAAITNNALLVLLAIAFLLPTIFMEKILQRYKSSSSSFDILTVRFYERSSYILFAFACIIGVLFAVQKVGLIGKVGI